jgi:hypothetical protein
MGHTKDNDDSLKTIELKRDSKIQDSHPDYSLLNQTLEEDVPSIGVLNKIFKRISHITVKSSERLEETTNYKSHLKLQES